jgi:hypothetical protein
VDVLPALVALGWLMISKDEGYCSDCTKTADRVAKAKAKKTSRRSTSNAEHHR